LSAPPARAEAKKIEDFAMKPDFGFSGQTLRADSALLPIAYYLYSIAGADNYVIHSRYLADR
jgi:hypothetical protein